MGRVEMTWTFTRSTPLRAAAGPSSPRTAREHRRGTRYSIVAIRRSSFAAVCAGSVRDYVEMKVCTLLTQPASAALICFITCGIGVDPLCWMMSRTLALIALRAFFFGSHLEKISVPFPPPGTAQVEPKEPGGLPLQRVHHPRQLPVQLHAQRRKLFMKPLQGALRPSPFAAVAADGDDHIIGEPVIGLRAHQQFCDPIRRPDVYGLLSRPAFGPRDTDLVEHGVRKRNFCRRTLSNRTPNGTPSPSPNTIHFVPLPRLVLPTASPLFRRRETAVQKGLVPFQQAFFIQRTQQRAPDPEPNSIFLPLLQPPPASRPRRILVGQKMPRCSGLQYPQNAYQAASVWRRRPAPPVLASLRFWKLGANQFALLIGQQHFCRLLMAEAQHSTGLIHKCLL